MGKHVDGHSYMQKVRLIRKIDDIPELKNRLIDIAETKSHKDMSRYSLLLAEHILEVSGVERDAAIDEAFAINEKWQAGEATFHEARQVALDRKSTRLNSSHVKISYAVFCLKKKKTSTS